MTCEESQKRPLSGRIRPKKTPWFLLLRTRGLMSLERISRRVMRSRKPVLLVSCRIVTAAMLVAQGRIRQRAVARYDYLGRSHERL